MKRTLSYIISHGDAGKTVKQFLRSCGVTASVLTMLKSGEDGILLNGERVFVTARLSAGDRLTVSMTDEGETAPPENLDVSILFEDEDLILFDKPAGMAVHPTKKIQSGTLAHAFSHHMAEQGQTGRFRPVYRLDRGTTGLVVVAKNRLACALLSGGVDKTYLALCEGTLPANGTFDGPIGLAEGSALRRCVRPDGQPAVTEFERLAVGDGWSMARVKLKTGRTHQIRCHFADAGHPLLGDFLYGTETPAWTRHALHCETVAFRHPVSGESLSFACPLQRDMAEFLKNS